MNTVCVTYLSTHSPTHYLPICNRVLLETVIGPGLVTPATIDVPWESHFDCFYHVPVLNKAEHFDPYNKHCVHRAVPFTGVFVLCFL